MANRFVTWEQATQAIAFQTYNSSKFLSAADTQYARDFQGSDFGDTIQIKKPVIYTAVDGRTRGTQDSKRPKVNLQLNIKKHVPMDFTIDEMAVNLDDFNREHARPAGQALADAVDLAIAEAIADQVYNAIGTPGAGGPSTLFHLLETGARLHDFNGLSENPQDMMFITTALGAAKITDSLKGALNTNISEEAIRAGFIGEAGGFMLGRSNNVIRHVVGAYNGTPLTAGATADGAVTVAFDGGSGNVTGYLKKGDIVTFAGVNAVNRINKADLGYLRQFVVTADVDTTSGAGTIPISPAIIASGPEKNVTNVPADNSAVTVMGTASQTYAQSVGLHKRAIALATVPLPLPAAPEAARAEYEGVSVLLTKQMNTATRGDIITADILGGVTIAYPEHACRYYG